MIEPRVLGARSRNCWRRAWGAHLAVYLLTTLCANTGCTTREKPVYVFVAASLQDAVEEVLAEFARERPEIPVLLNAASSGTLRRQIERSGRADVFFSADPAEIETLVEGSLIDPETVRVPLANELVVVRARAHLQRHQRHQEGDLQPASALDESAILQQLAAARRIAIGQPDTVPAGRYARTWLQKLGKWQELEGKMVPTTNVRAVIAAVRSGGAELGIVYATDALRFDEVEVVFRLQNHLPHAPAIRYALAPLGVAGSSGTLSGDDRRRRVLEVFAALCSEDAFTVYRRHGFARAPGSAPGAACRAAGRLARSAA